MYAILEEIERGVVSIRNSHDLSGEVGDVCQRQAERLVQWALAIRSYVADGEVLFQNMLAIREVVNAEVEESTVQCRGRPSIPISESQLLFLLEHGSRAHAYITPTPEYRRYIRRRYCTSII